MAEVSLQVFSCRWARPRTCLSSHLDRPVAVTIYNGSHVTTLKMPEGFQRKDDIKVTNPETMPQQLEAVRQGEFVAATFTELWISVAPKPGCRIIMESHIHPTYFRMPISVKNAAASILPN